MSASFYHFEGLRKHCDLAGGNSYTMGIGFIANINHVGLPAGIKMS